MSPSPYGVELHEILQVSASKTRFPSPCGGDKTSISEV